MMKIGILGAGCVGATFAERLSAVKNASVRFVAGGKIAAEIKSAGVVVNGQKLNVPVVASAERDFDVVLICVKNYDLEKACRDLKRFISTGTVLIPFLNSISPTPTVRAFFPRHRVLYGYISRIDTYKSDDGYRYNIPGEVHFGEARNKTVSGKLKKIRNVFERAGFDVQIDEDMIRGIWRKWMLNVGANQVSALTEANYLQFAKIPEVERILRLAMHELLVIAACENVNLSTADVQDLIAYLTTYKFPKRTSMLQDVMARRKTEIDYISGDILRLSKKWNVPCPVNLTMYYLIKSKEKAYLNH